MDLLFIILEDPNMQTDVKTIAIIAIGDICLMSETSFQPYFQKTMDTLIVAGQLSLQAIDPNLPIDEEKGIHDLR